MENRNIYHHQFLKWGRGQQQECYTEYNELCRWSTLAIMHYHWLWMYLSSPPSQNCQDRKLLMLLSQRGRNIPSLCKMSHTNWIQAFSQGDWPCVLQEEGGHDDQIAVREIISHLLFTARKEKQQIIKIYTYKKKQKTVGILNKFWPKHLCG